MMQNMMVAPPIPVSAPGRSLFGAKRRKVNPAVDDGTLGHKGMPMVLSRAGAEARDGNAPKPGLGGGSAGGWSLGADGVTIGDGAPARAMPSQHMPQGGPLGGSMRQPFDYEAAKAALVGEKPEVKDWQKIMAIVGDALVQHSGGQPMAMQNIVARQNDYSKRQFEAAQQILDWQHGNYEAQRDADLRAANPYTIGRERLAYDPATGRTDVQYRGRQDAEIYADTMGFDRGSEEWTAAVEDYVLRSSGPSAHERDMEIDDHRTANDRSLEGYRQQNRLQMEGARQSNRVGMVDYRNANPPPSRSSRGAARPTATDGKGNKIEFDGKKWVPAK